MIIKFDIYPRKDSANSKPIQKMTELGITWEKHFVSTISDCVFFFNCKNIPEAIPQYIQVQENRSPLEFVGCGLSENEANQLIENLKI